MDLSQYDILRVVIAPIITIILGITTITILVSSYYLVFRIKRYITKSKFFLDYIKKLNRTVHNTELCSGHMHRDDISGSDLEQNKKMIYEMLTKFKTADLKDMIIGTYKEELSSVSSMINYNYKAMRKNNDFLKFQRLFHVYHNGTTRLLFLNNEYISFYKIHRRYVEVGIVSKDAVQKFSHNFYRENLSALYESEIHHLATVYNLYFFNNNLIFKNVRNPKPELEEKFNEIRPIYKEVIKPKNKNYNIYLEKNFIELFQIEDESLTFIKRDKLILEPITSKARARLVEETRQIKEIRTLRKETKKTQSRVSREQAAAKRKAIDEKLRKENASKNTTSRSSAPMGSKSTPKATRPAPAIPKKTTSLQMDSSSSNQSRKTTELSSEPKLNSDQTKV